MKEVIINAFSEEAINKVARKTGFVKRARKLTASSFLNTLMFSVCNQQLTSLPDITSDLSANFDVDISKEALHKKFTSEAVAFLKEMVSIHIKRQFDSIAGKNVPFPSIKTKDSSKYSLPDVYEGAYPGFGNFSKKNGLMNIQYEYDLVKGTWLSVELTNVTRNDQKDSKETLDSITKGDLHIRDLGYITPSYLERVIDRGAFFLNRLPSQVNIYTPEKKKVTWKDIDKKLKKTGTPFLEVDVLIYRDKFLSCRLILEPVSDDEYRKRLIDAEKSAKSRKVGVSDDHKIRCRYNAFITNVDREILPVETIRKTYYLRWQIELVFKTWKSYFEINKVKKVKKERMECQLLAKLLWILLNWNLFRACNQYLQKNKKSKRVSTLKFFKRCLSFSSSLRSVVLRRISIKKWLIETFIPSIDNTACEAPRGKTTHYQILKATGLSLS